MLGLEGRRFGGPQPRLEHEPHEQVVAVGTEIPLVWLGEETVRFFLSQNPRELIGAGHGAEGKLLGRSEAGNSKNPPNGRLLRIALKAIRIHEP